jgi:quercetin dioxygenase-like cupin family protein
VRKFAECPTYGEAIKSAKTTSRTLLPKDVVPRMSIGTVETIGPDKVAPHAHPMLEQFFLGLEGNDIVVHADGAQTALGANTLLHIPLGSSHGAEVAEGKKLHYVWMDRPRRRPEPGRLPVGSQTLVSERILAALRVPLVGRGRAEPGVRHTDDVEVYHLYLKASTERRRELKRKAFRDQVVHPEAGLSFGSRPGTGGGAAANRRSVSSGPQASARSVGAWPRAWRRARPAASWASSKKV